MKIDGLKLLLITTIMTTYFGFGNSTLVVVPRDTVAVVEQLAYFNCSTSDVQSPKIHWHYNDKHVYAGEGFLDPYDKRFKIETDNATGSVNLVIPNVTKDDAGRYRCLDNEGFGEQRSVELVVLDAEPMCTSNMKAGGVVGPNSCNVDPEDVRLSCSVSFSGNIAPILKWKPIGDSSPINTGITTCKNSANRVECNLTVKADLHLDGLSYVCHTDTKPNINCTSDPIKIISAFNDFRITEKSINDELRCKSSSSQSCNYQWTWNALNGSTAVLSDQSNVTATSSGIYQCQSECNIHGKQCTVSAVLVYIPSDNKSAELPSQLPNPGATSSEDKSALIFVVVILVALLVVCIICCILMFCYFKRRKVKPKPPLESNELQPFIQTIQGPTENDHREGNEVSFDETDHTNQQQIEPSVELQEIQPLNPANQELKKEISRLKEELSKEQSSHETDRQETERLRNDLQTSKDKNEILEKQINDREKEWSKQEAALKKQKADLEEKLKSETNALKTQLEENKRNMEEKIKRLTERNNELSHCLCIPPKEPSLYKAELHQIIQTQAVQKDKKLGACGVAVLYNELFVITDSHPQIEVYNLSTFEPSRCIKLYGVTDPGDIVACDKNKRLYIVDWTGRNRENKILRLDVNGKEDIQRLSLTDDECRMFITKDANILVTFHRSRKIIEYTPELQVVFQTKIEDANIHPIHAVKLSNGLLALCHGKDKERTHRVCIVDDDGNLLKSFGGPKGAEVGQVNFPIYLAVDKNDTILVADRKNGRVLRLNSCLELMDEILSKENDIRFPRALLLDETNSRLFVADCDNEFYNGRVLVFNLK